MLLPQFRRGGLGHYLLRTLLLCGPSAAWAQVPGLPVPAYPSIVSVSPVELFYKAQLGYEHRLGKRNSLGVLGTARYGLGQLYQGWQATGYYRRFLTQQFPTGLYVQAQASVFDFKQEANLYHIKTRDRYSFAYQGLSGGGGIGVGYRTYLLRQATQGRLLWNVLLGGRAQVRPLASYDSSTYQPVLGFLGDGAAFSWHMGFSPGSIVHGLLTLDYQF